MTDSTRTNGTTSHRGTNGQRPTLITGGAGFVGSNLANRLLGQGHPVVVFDNLSRPGVERNLEWLRGAYGSLLSVQVGDVRDAGDVREAVQHVGQVFHFAGQVAVTTSLDDPADDFAVNTRGTFNVLEALRRLDDPPPLVFTSTNKVYGNLADVALRETEERYVPEDPDVRAHGISEQRPLDFHSPYGCSKGAADQYVLDYARTYDLPAVVFRMSCIYGDHQFGTEDQGWVAHFVRSVIEGQPLTLFGDGKQVRDVLYVKDLVDAFLLAQEHMSTIRGAAFNIGGGPDRSISLLELINLVTELHGKPPRVEHDDWRRGDQRYFVADTRRFAEATGWQPRVSVREGAARLYRWLSDAPFVEASTLAAVAKRVA